MRAIVCLIMLCTAVQAAPVPKPSPPDPLGKGYMGVYAAGEGSLQVSRVEPNTPASAAGLRGGDLLVQIGPLRPQTFEEVREMIGSLRPGTRIDIIVKRGDRETATVLILANRPANFGSMELTEPLP